VSRSSRIIVRKRDLNFRKFSGWIGQVWYQDRTTTTFDDRFERNLIIVSSIDHIILPLALSFCWDHVYIVGKCFHHFLAERLLRVLISGHRPILEKNFIWLPFTPLPCGFPLGP
jgi:hypothetical protein